MLNFSTPLRYKEIHSDKAAITGLAFNKEVALFVATETAVHSYKKVRCFVGIFTNFAHYHSLCCYLDSKFCKGLVITGKMVIDFPA